MSIFGDSELPIAKLGNTYIYFSSYTYSCGFKSKKEQSKYGTLIFTSDSIFPTIYGSNGCFKVLQNDEYNNGASKISKIIFENKNQNIGVSTVQTIDKNTELTKDFLRQLKVNLGLKNIIEKYDEDDEEE